MFHVYDEGMAYRFISDRKDDLIILDETAEINFGEDHMAWLPYSTNTEKPMAMAYQNTYDYCRLSKAKDILAFLPVTVDCGHAKVTVMESDLESYPGMFIKTDKEKKGLKGVFAKYPSPSPGMTAIL